MNSLKAAVMDLAHEVSLFATHVDALRQADDHLEDWNQSFECDVRNDETNPALSSPESDPVHRKVHDAQNTQPEHVKRLERIWCAIESKPVSEFMLSLRNVWATNSSHLFTGRGFQGCALGDLVRCCGCSVLQVNEYLATLVKHGLVVRKKTRTALAYFVSVEGSQN
ncbi:Hypothetical Protein FCC1311_031842 [Hondaea fermentalgiana]|uniref:Uncharacterized protein n=1 Tax=Hondaea fermentalgiana TaxID=2315210 RepID=A0A2R5GFD8_9STRA|nr:Hypothetical Protein FCC1311_031842 [Hondaea fermentalgiana]|eukprot:GBG26961.1 Hypothetical Protein FCC1311_031842 [Hondaea fermentalgiana]